MNDEQIMLLTNDPEYQAWIASEPLSNDEMDEDGFLISQFEEYEDGEHERLDARMERF